VVRSASAGGANFEGARVAESRGGFLHKVGVAAQKVRETAFWLALIGRSGWPSAELKAALREAQQLAAILDASAKTARSQPP
jgi:four helix bundle protein